MDEPFQFGIPDGVNETTLHPLGLVAVLVFGTAMLFLPRRYAMLPVILTACLIAPAQRIAIFTLNFTLLRMMVAFGMVRLVTRAEYRGLTWKAIDTAVLGWAVCGTIAYILLRGDADAVKYRLGWAYDLVGMYFLFRCLVRDWRDVRTITWIFIFVSLPVAGAFLVESRTGHNLFAFFGGVPAVTVVREGRLRCQGAFSHPILAGCFWVVVMPLMAAMLWGNHRERTGGIVGLCAAAFIIMACASSTPVSAVLVAIACGCLFGLRYHMRWVQVSFVVAVVVLHLIMNHPVWFLFTKIDLAGGSTGWYRYWLTDLAIKNFGDWWMLGTQDTDRWVAGTGFNFLDVTNQYIWEGINGGVLSLAFFVAAIALAFGGVGRLWRMVRTDRARTAVAWALGVSLFVHVTNFFGVSYFGQISMLLCLSLAMIASLTPPKAVFARALRRRRVRGRLRPGQAPRSVAIGPRRLRRRSPATVSAIAR